MSIRRKMDFLGHFHYPIITQIKVYLFKTEYLNLLPQLSYTRVNQSYPTITQRLLSIGSLAQMRRPAEQLHGLHPCPSASLHRSARWQRTLKRGRQKGTKMF